MKEDLIKLRMMDLFGREVNYILNSTIKTENGTNIVIGLDQILDHLSKRPYRLERSELDIEDILKRLSIQFPEYSFTLDKDYNIRLFDLLEPLQELSTFKNPNILLKYNILGQVILKKVSKLGNNRKNIAEACTHILRPYTSKTPSSILDIESIVIRLNLFNIINKKLENGEFNSYWSDSVKLLMGIDDSDEEHRIDYQLLEGPISIITKYPEITTLNVICILLDVLSNHEREFEDSDCPNLTTNLIVELL